MEPIVDMPVPRIRKEIGEVNQLISRDRISECIDEQVDVAAPKIRERNVEVAKWCSQEQVQNRVAGRFVGVTVPRNFNDVDERMALEASARENRARLFEPKQAWESTFHPRSSSSFESLGIDIKSHKSGIADFSDQLVAETLCRRASQNRMPVLERPRR